MGCWDIFCFICGNRNYSFDKNYIDEIENDVKLDKIPSSYSTYYRNYIKKLKSYPNIITDLKVLSKNTKWMDKCSILLINGQVVHGVKEKSCNVEFYKKNFHATHIQEGLNNDCSFELNGNCGIFIHTDCWKFIKKNYNIGLKFSDLPKTIYVGNHNYNKNFNINYGDIEKYWAQDFDFAQLVVDKKMYLCSNPLLNDNNVKQIKKNIKELKIKNDVKRKGPSASATFYNDGDIKIGNNKHFWIIKNNRWIEINDPVIKIKININVKKLNKKQINYLNKIPFIGQYNSNPIFILSYKEIKKNLGTIELILNESYKNTFYKIIE